MGRFTDYISNAAQRFRDPGQILDAFLPGDIRQDGRWVPSGIAAGVGQVASGGALPAALTQPLIGRIGSMLGGQSQASAPRINAIRSNQAAGVPRIDSVIPANEQGQIVRNEVDAGIPMGAAPSSGNRPRLSRGESGGGGNMGGVTLGLGQLGRGGDESLAAFAASLFTRGGTQAEQ